MSIEIGQKAPDFSALICNGEKAEPFKLSDHLGQSNLVIAFFPFAFSGVCTDEFCTFRDNKSQYEELNAKIFGISVDAPPALNAWIKDQGFEFGFLSDFNKDISRSFGALHEDLGGLKGVSKRSIFVLNKEGVVKFKWISDDPKVQPDFGDVQNALQNA